MSDTLEQFVLLSRWWQAQWREVNGCGLCYMGPCMCSIIQPSKHATVPVNIDDHMITVDPFRVRANTVAFVMSYKKRWTEADEKEWWEEYYDERHRVSFNMSADGYYTTVMRK